MSLTLLVPSLNCLLPRVTAVNTPVTDAPERFRGVSVVVKNSCVHLGDAYFTQEKTAPVPRMFPGGGLLLQAGAKVSRMWRGRIPRVCGRVELRRVN